MWKGIAFPFSKGEHSFPDTACDSEKVKGSIMMILGTVVGERVMRPEFGCRIQELVFSPADDVTEVKAQVEIERALRRWEPRAVLLGVGCKVETAGAKKSLVCDVVFSVNGVANSFEYNREYVG